MKTEIDGEWTINYLSQEEIDKRDMMMGLK
jgi:hypothetical protein